MKQLLYIIFLFGLGTCILYAQTDDKQLLKHRKNIAANIYDYVAYKLVEKRMEEYLVINPNSIEEETAYKNLRKKYSKNKISNPPPSGDVSDFLKENSWDITNIRVFIPLAEDLEDCIEYLYKEDIKNCFSFKLDNRIINRNNYFFKKGLKEEVDVYLNENWDKLDSSSMPTKPTKSKRGTKEIDNIDKSPSEIEGEVGENKGTSNRDEGTNSLFKWLLNLIGVLVAAIIFFLIWRNYDRLKRFFFREKGDNKLSEGGKNIKSQDDFTKKRLEMGNTPPIETPKYEQVDKSKFNNKPDKIASQEDFLTDDFSIELYNKKNQQTSFTKKIIYLPAPKKDGTFNVSDEDSKEIKHKSIYQFELANQAGTEARFVLINKKEVVQDALTISHRILEPVCVYNNGFKSDAMNIFTEKPGIVVKEGDKWSVRVKAKIRFE